ncbi:class I SAM-dependent methyltransferase [Desulforamulus ruminis]|uniref:Methyltransferase type 11 n=1 Tax=Desulforamulus ruminis (strain ATCC 23193 / DSM 2154 / NCIMB 8452 / DL) TaxID=696281 RepID=F6DV00_DESRL|nr:class I SAM-dependent methyltransferase [Desulforamulus ruminis]AEG61397.1 Methyltransferase type 11 [Desulforamulus ruminis DSM 2154]
MPHVFDAKQKHKLDNPERRKMLPPVETLQKFGLQPGDVVADIGCGIGYFTIPAAKMVGEEGKVFALDISEEMLMEVKNRSAVEGIGNLELLKVEENQFSLASDSTTFVFLAFVLHEVPELKAYLLQVIRILKSGGRIAIIEWQKRDMPMGPPVKHRLAQEDLIHILGELGLQSIQDIHLSDSFYGLVAQKA